MSSYLCTPWYVLSLYTSVCPPMSEHFWYVLLSLYTRVLKGFGMSSYLCTLWYVLSLYTLVCPISVHFGVSSYLCTQAGRYIKDPLLFEGIASAAGGCRIFESRGSTLGLHAKRGSGDPALGTMLKNLHRGPKESVWWVSGPPPDSHLWHSLTVKKRRMGRT